MVPPVTTSRLNARLRGSAAAARRRGPAAAAALGSAAALAGCGGTQADWAIVESGPKGQTLVIQPLIALSSCDGTPKVDVRKSNANKIELGVTVDEGGDCDSDGAKAPEPISVELSQPLRGQQISGPGLKPPTANPAAKQRETVPSVVGFRVPDARAILAASNLTRGTILGPKGDATEVTAQAPEPRSPLESGGIVSLRTVPR